MKIDLHMHSDQSLDGEATPEEIARLAKEAGLRYAALSDHDEVTGIDRFVAAAGPELEVVPAVELDTDFCGLEPHVLGYYINWHDPRWAQLHDSIHEQHVRTTQAYCRNIRALGIALDQDEVDRRARNGVAATELMTRIALADPRNDGNAILEPYRPGGARADMPLVNFYWDWCAPGKPCYTNMKYMPMEEAVRLITDTGGVPVLAHPGQTFGGQTDLALRALDCGMRGIEAYSGYHDAAQCAYWARVGADRGLVCTCGSDWHGSIKPHNFMGVHGAGPRQAEETIAGLQRLRQ